MGFLSWWQERFGPGEEEKRKRETATGFVVLHIPKGTPPFDLESLEKIRVAMDEWGAECEFPLRFHVVQAEMREGA